MRFYGIVENGSDFLYVSIIDLDKYKGKSPIVSLDVQDTPVPMFTFDSMQELVETWCPYDGDFRFVEFGAFDIYGDYYSESKLKEGMEPTLYNKTCTYSKGILRKVTYEKIGLDERA